MRALIRRSLLVLGFAVLVALVYASAIRSADARPATPTARAPVTRACDREHPGECHRAIAYWRRQAREAAAAVAWQRKQRWRAKATQVRDVTADAIRWAAEKYTATPARARALAAQMTGIGTCESHLWLWATNGQFMSWAQLSAWHRSDPVIARLTWRDPYAVADHVARYLLANGEGEWQCVSTGGLRW